MVDEAIEEMVGGVVSAAATVALDVARTDMFPTASFAKIA